MELQQYAEVLIDEKGYDDVDGWKELTNDDLETMGFKQGHSRKFIKKVQEHFMEVINDDEEAQNNMTVDGALMEEQEEGIVHEQSEDVMYTHQ